MTFTNDNHMDLTDRQGLVYYLRSHGLWTQKKLGQNFLVDKNVLEKIVDVAKLQPTDTVLEIGPGVGALTWGLSPKVKDGLLLAIEKDFRLVELLRQQFKNARHVKIIHGDIRRFDLCSVAGEYKVVGNIPYYLTSLLIRKLLEVKCASQAPLSRSPNDQILMSNPPAGEAGQIQNPNVKNNSKTSHSSLISHFELDISHSPSLIVLTVQKEVAERITAKPGGSNRGVLTVMVELLADAEIITDVPRSSFYPEPDVDSAIIQLRPYETQKQSDRETKKQDGIDNNLIMRIVKAGFSAKRRQLHNSLVGGLGLAPSKIHAMLDEARINGKNRAEDLTIRQWQELADAWHRQATSD